ncbi:hypothetical protein A4X09_0g7111 [Tilletia walkeri]|uniref:RNA-directed RNA polymerase n=1 Tax=Tilletia walkeri TaxID=117179 RepID=A0A8X7N1K1_9BASI|nr:hypothetical protein A4X09_0g7111 [Tilletia walkeri]
MHMGEYTNSFNESRQMAPHAVPGNMLSYLDNAGIPRPLPGARPHPHPVHVALERRMLHFAGLLLRDSPWFGLFMRQEKVQHLNTSGRVAPPTGYFNPRLAGKDLARYQATAPPTSLSPRNDTAVWFAHDVLHHLNASTVGQWFDDNPTLEHLVATAVIPPETVWDLPCVTNDLYRFAVVGEDLIYVPERHNGGQYVQPYSARNWLMTDRLVTASGECLHVSLLETNHAHHLFVISRHQLLAENRRVLDMPELSSIPFMAHPFGSPFSRLTTPSLLAALEGYSTRVSATNMRDLYAKIASSQAETYGRYPSSFARAAALHALRLRSLDFHTSGGVLSYVWAWLGELLRLPLLPIPWLVQSISSRRFSAQLDVGLIWHVKCSYLVAQSRDRPMPGLIHSVCDAHAVPLFYLPPKADTLALTTDFFARFFVFMGVKLILFPASTFLVHHLDSLPQLIAWATDMFDMTWTSTPLGVVCVLLSMWYGVRGPGVPWPNFLHPVTCLARNMYSLYWGLCSNKRCLRHGRSWHSLTFSVLLPVLLAWPKFGPLYCRYRDIRFHWFEVVCMGTLWVVSFFEYEPSRRPRLPWHRTPPIDPYRDEEDVSSTYTSSSSSSGGSDNSSVPPAFTRVPQLEDSRFAHLVADDIELLPRLGSPPPPSVVESVPSTRSHSPPVAPRPLTPVEEVIPFAEPGIALLPQDPYWRFALRPSSYDSFHTWGAVVALMPDPPNQLDPQHSCVWDCIASTFGLRSDVVHAMFLASMAPAQRGPWFNGLVPYSELSRVFTFFGLGVTLHSASRAGADCPRIPGNTRLPVYDRKQRPLMSTKRDPFGLDCVYFLAPADDDTYHLTTAADNEAGTGDNIPTIGAMIGFVSRQVTALELGTIVNAPVKVFLQSWARMNGTLVSAPALTSQLPAGRLPDIVQLPRLPVREEVINYSLSAADLESAYKLAQDIKNNPEQLDVRDHPMTSIARGLYEQVKYYRKATRNGEPAPAVKLHLFHGAPGSGKSFAVLNSLAARHAVTPFTSANLRFHCWLNCLRGPLEAAANAVLPGLMSHNFQTGCMPFVQPLPGTLVLDDATQLWPGFIQMLIATNPQLTDIYLTFDVTQGRSAFPVADALSRSSLSTSEWLAPLSSYYATESWRLSTENSRLFGLPAPLQTAGHRVTRGIVALVSNVINDLPLLVVSPRFATSQNDGGQRCMTFRECQGFTIDGDVTIDLGGLSATATDHAWWTALTRARGNIMFYLGPLSQGKGLNESLFGRSNIASAIMAVMAHSGRGVISPADDPAQLIARAVQAHLSRCLSPAACTTLGLAPRAATIGSRVGSSDRAEWLSTPRPDYLGDFYTARTHRALQKGHKSSPGTAFSRYTALAAPVETREAPHLLRHYVALHNDHVLHSDPSTYVMPPPPEITAQPDPALQFDTLVDADTREVVAPNHNATTQHVHDGPNAILHHTRSDRLTDAISRKKRIKIGVDRSDLTAHERTLAKRLRNGFKKFFDVEAWSRERFDLVRFEMQSRNSFQSWVSKRTKKQIERSIGKNPIDSYPNFAHLFLKSQYVKKEASRFAPAKAGQTVSEFNLVRQFRDAPFAHYVEELALKHARPSTYLHCRASPTEMSSWYKEHWKPGERMTANDYTAWDSGCDRVFLDFDVWIMGLCGIPNEYINRYQLDRATTTSYAGPHMIRQESGDRWTWLLNTLRNAAITGISLRCPPSSPAAFSGDDSVVLGDWRAPKEFNPRDWTMQPKPEFGTSLEFCGYAFGGHDISLSPAVVLHRSQYGLALGRNDEDYWRSIADAICEAGVTAPDYSPVLATARLNLLTAATKYGFPSRGPLVFK